MDIIGVRKIEITAKTPSLGKGAAGSEVAGRGFAAVHLCETPPSTLPREGIAQGLAFEKILPNTYSVDMKAKAFWGTLLLVLINVCNLFAQGTPCGDSGDPDDPTTCPLDTWVFVLVAAALIFATLHLYRRQKHATAA